MWKLLFAVFLLISLTSAQNKTIVSISLFASNLSGCDSLSACDAVVRILCSSVSADWTQCGITAEVKNDNNPKWPEIFNFEHDPADRLRWRFDVVDRDVAVDDPIGSFSVIVEDFLNLTSVSVPNLETDLAGRGTLHVHQIFEEKV